MAIALDPPYAYIGTFHEGLAVMDIRDPSLPRLVSDLDMGRSCTSALPHGDYLFMGYLDAGVGLVTLDISDPEDPALLNDLSLEYCPRDMCRSGDYLFMLQWEDGAWRDEASAPGRKQVRLAPSSEDRHSDIMVLDISDPVAPVPVTTFPVPYAYVEFLHIDGDLLYASFWTYESWYGNNNPPPGGNMDMRVEVVFYGE